jgi:peptidoglycan hydrolase CwlO-like protein
LNLVAMLVALGVMAWACYTTGSGMVGLMQNPIGAAIGTLAVIAILAITSWLLGGDIAVFITPERRRERPAPARFVMSILVFLFVFCISVFFSYTYYYRTVSLLGGTRLTAEDQPRMLADLVAPRLRGEVKKAYEADVAQTRKLTPVSTWEKDADKILSMAGPNGANVQQKIVELQKRAGAARQQLAMLRADKEAKEGLIRGYDKQLADSNERLGDLSDQLAAAEADVIKATNGDDMSHKRGRGPIAREAQARQADLERQIKSLTESREDIQKKRDVEQTAVNAILDSIKKAEADVPSSLAGIDSIGNNGALPVDDFDKLRADFLEDPLPERFDAARNRCSLVLRALRDSGLNPGDAVDCGAATSPIVQAINDRMPRVRARRQFDKDCTLEGGGLSQKSQQLREDVHGEKIRPVDALRAFRKDVTDCIDVARNVGVPSETLAGFSSEVKTFVDNNTLEANHFELARRALFSLNRDWPLALGIAVVQDLFILFLKLFTEIFGYQQIARRASITINLDVSDRESDSPDLRATKALLRFLVPGRVGSSIKLDSDEVNDLPSEVSSNLDTLVKRLVRNRQARWLQDNVYLVQDDVISDIERTVLEASTHNQMATAGLATPQAQARTDGPHRTPRSSDGAGQTAEPRTQSLPHPDFDRRGSLDDYVEWEGPYAARSAQQRK